MPLHKRHSRLTRYSSARILGPRRMWVMCGARVAKWNLTFGLRPGGQADTAHKAPSRSRMSDTSLKGVAGTV
jgi:hypothetical protein